MFIQIFGNQLAYDIVWEVRTPQFKLPSKVLKFQLAFFVTDNKYKIVFGLFVSELIQ